MKTRFAILTVLLGLLLLQTLANAQQSKTSPCTGPNGSRFNLEPRPNAVVQAAQSVAVLPGLGKNKDDLIFATAVDARAIVPGLPAPAQGFYVQRSNANCTPDLEGELPLVGGLPITTAGGPIAVADPAHNAFFAADLEFNETEDVGVLKATPASLLNTASCPKGTQSKGSASCFVAAAADNLVNPNIFLFNPQLAVDQRTKGTGAGDVYVAVTQDDRTGQSEKVTLSLTACTNATLNCSTAIPVNGVDAQPDYSFVQVLPDGRITITYRNTTFPGINPEDIKFVTCTPNGAPAAPTCSAPVLVAHEKTPDFASFVGVTVMDVLSPIHTNRLEKDGSITTFVVYDRCEVPVLQFAISIAGFCPKGDVAITSSTDGGKTWSPVANVTKSKGQQFFGTIATDASTGTVNLAYYSTENDPVRQEHVQVFLAQIAPGTTTVGTPQLLTSAFADPATAPSAFVLFQPTGLGDRLGITASGTGTAGQSRAYVTFTWDSVPGTYNGAPSADTNNHLTLFQY